MSFRTRRVVLTAPFYLIFEYFLFKYLFSLYGGISDLYLIILVLILTAIRTIPTLFEEKKSTKIGRFFSTLSGIWLWFLMMIFIYLVVIYIIEIFIKIPVNILSIILLTIPLIGIYAYYNAHKIVIKEKTLKFDNLEEEYNIAHLSDVHFGSVRHKQLIEDLRDKLMKLSNTCDMAIISGDLADGSSEVEEDDFEALKDVKMPIIFTPGNHDYYIGIENVIKACKKADIIVLDNNGWKYKNLNIFGLSFSFGEIETVTPEQLKDFTQKNKINILNYHVPTKWEEFVKLGFDIQLSGHTHGGQFYPVKWLGNLMFEGHNMGLYHEKQGEKDKYLHVTTGIGSMDTPMRWGTNSEIVVLKLRSK